MDPYGSPCPTGYQSGQRSITPSGQRSVTPSGTIVHNKSPIKIWMDSGFDNNV